MKKLLVDANIVLEMLLKRKKYWECVDFISNTDFILEVSVLTTHLVYYFAAKDNIPLEISRKYINMFRVASMDNDVYQLAISINKVKDLEDALQVATAIVDQFDGIVTLDKKMKSKYGVFATIRAL